MSNHEEDRPERVSNAALQIRSWKNRIRLHSVDRNDLLLESIDEVFVDLLGARVRDAFYDSLERNQRIAREELSRHLDKFQEVLETVLGSGGDTVGRTIAKRFYAKLALDFTPRSNYKLTDYVEAAKTESRSWEDFVTVKLRHFPSIVNAKVVALTAAIIFTVFYWFAQTWGSNLVVFTDVLFIVVSGACAFVAFLPARKWKEQGRLGVVHLGLFLAVLFWFLGESVWGIYEVLLAVEVPYPSAADIFYLAGYLPALLGITFFLVRVKTAIRGIAFQAIILSGLTIIGSSVVFLINPIIASGSSNLAKIFDVGYPSLDTILLVLAVTMLIAFADGKIGQSWFWISFGMILTTMADLAFSFGTLSGWYYSGHPIELLWLWGYIGLALGFNAQRKQLSSFLI